MTEPFLFVVSAAWAWRKASIVALFVICAGTTSLTAVSFGEEEGEEYSATIDASELLAGTYEPPVDPTLPVFLGPELSPGILELKAPLTTGETLTYSAPEPSSVVLLVLGCVVALQAWTRRWLKQCPSSA